MQDPYCQLHDQAKMSCLDTDAQHLKVWITALLLTWTCDASGVPASMCRGRLTHKCRLVVCARETGGQGTMCLQAGTESCWMQTITAQYWGFGLEGGGSEVCLGWGMGEAEGCCWGEGW